MKELYRQLTERAQALNEEREALISRRNKLENELNVIKSRLNTVDESLEDIYKDQESYWPGKVVQSELLGTGSLIKEFYAHPDVTQQELAEMYNISTYAVSERISNHFKKAAYNRAI